MNAIVCIKRVPDTEARIKVTGEGIDPSGLKYVISPYDEFAIEAALRTVDGGEVTVVTVGGSESGEQLRSALAMGASRAVLLEGEPGMDGLATARALAAEIGESGAELVLLGMKAVDHDQQQVGPMLAELLDLPCVTAVASFEVEDGSVVCHREVEGGVEVVACALPAVVTLTKGEFEPRLPSLKGIMAAKRKPLETKPAQLGEARVTVRSLVPPAERPPGRVVGEGAEAVPALIQALRDDGAI